MTDKPGDKPSEEASDNTSKPRATPHALSIGQPLEHLERRARRRPVAVDQEHLLLGADPARPGLEPALAQHAIRHIPVEDNDHRLVGLVTYRAVLRFLAGGGSMQDTPVSAIMKTEVTTVGVETRTIDAIQLMRTYRFGCVPVVQDGHLVGILTEEDFMNVASKLLEQQLGETRP